MAIEIVCPICFFATKHENILNAHCLSIHDADPELLYQQTNNTTCFCRCGCGTRLSWNGWRRGYSKFLRGHNANVDTSFSKHDIIEKISKKRKDGFKSGKFHAWNEGLTKETSEIVRNSSEKRSNTLIKRFECGDLVPWQSRENAEISFKKISETKTKNFLNGITTSWNTGLTKNTDDRLNEISKKISEKMTGRSARRIPLDDLKMRLSIHSDRLKLESNLDEYTSKYQRLKFSCKEGHISEKTLRMYELNPVCFICHPKESTAQLDIADFIKKLHDNILISDRNIIAPRELDIVVRDLYFAVEYNSLYYHSEKCLHEKDYHEKKTVAAANNGISLLHIFEDEWRDKRHIIESMIRHRMGMTLKKHYARCLTLQQLTQNDMQLFFDNTHIDGHTRAEAGFGLIDSEGKIVSAMSIRIPIHKKSYSNSLEIARYSTRLNEIVVGGTGKLLSRIKQYAKETNRTKIITYADTRHGTGTGYKKAGMIEQKSTSIRFWWTDGISRFDRFKFRADSINKISEADVAKNAGVWKIWGCRNRVYTILV